MSIRTNDHIDYKQLPDLLRLAMVLQLLPIGRSTFLAGVKQGIYPAPRYLGHTPVWRREDIQRLIDSL
jgi:predicted DNA-binding transcriptional regulator AlpA